jgi:hypothetical protein
MEKYKIDSRTYFYIKKSLLSQIEPKEIIKNLPDESLSLLFSKFIQDQEDVSYLEFKYILNTQTNFALPRVREFDASFLFEHYKNDAIEKYIEKCYYHGIDIIRVFSAATGMPEDICKRNLLEGKVSRLILLDIFKNQVAYL